MRIGSYTPEAVRTVAVLDWRSGSAATIEMRALTIATEDLF